MTILMISTRLGIESPSVVLPMSRQLIFPAMHEDLVDEMRIELLILYATEGTI